MYARVVRFTDVDSERMDGLSERVKSDEGPPPGVKSTGIKIFHDAAQSTAVVVAMFATEEDMKAADEVFSKMDAGDTPGTRASVDQTELKLERDM